MFDLPDDLIRCCRCHESKPPDDFSWKRKDKGQRDTHCKPCRSAYGKEHYAANKQRYIDRAAVVRHNQRLKRTKWLIAYFVEHPCIDCGETDPVVLEFDHVGEKRFDIGNRLDKAPWAMILEEIERCEVVCCNCHRRRTAWRRGSVRALLTYLGAGDRA